MPGGFCRALALVCARTRLRCSAGGLFLRIHEHSRELYFCTVVTQEIDPQDGIVIQARAAVMNINTCEIVRRIPTISAEVRLHRQIDVNHA